MPENNKILLFLSFVIDKQMDKVIIWYGGEDNVFRNNLSMG